MIKLTKIIFFIFFFLNLSVTAFTKENFFDEGVKLFKKKKYEDAKFSFERSIVLIPNMLIHIYT